MSLLAQFLGSRDSQDDWIKFRGAGQVLMNILYHIGILHEAAGDPNNAARAFTTARCIGRQEPDNEVGAILSTLIEARVAG